jgi:hypothetical protein
LGGFCPCQLVVARRRAGFFMADDRADIINADMAEDITLAAYRWVT